MDKDWVHVVLTMLCSGVLHSDTAHVCLDLVENAVSNKGEVPC